VRSDDPLRWVIRPVAGESAYAKAIYNKLVSYHSVDNLSSKKKSETGHQLDQPLDLVSGAAA